MTQESYINAEAINEDLAEVDGLMASSLENSSLAALSTTLSPALFGGKKLRARMLLRLGPPAGIPHEKTLRCAAGVELLHAASLLHDDVIDGAQLRRGAPSFWVEKGAAGAILLGDLLVCQAIGMIDELGDTSLVREMVARAREMCNAEIEQELILRGGKPDWKTSISLARRKTGSLFAFTGYACKGNNQPLGEALRESGYLLGTAYQLADDLFDAYSPATVSDKTIGLDAVHSKITGASAMSSRDVNPNTFIRELCIEATEILTPWPPVCAAWDQYLKQDIYPQLSVFTANYPTDATIKDTQ